MKRKICTLLLSGLFVTFGVAVEQARAALGETVDSLKSDETSLKAMRGAAISRTGYTVHEIISDANVVREYVSPSGVVFGIAWKGLVHPDLDALLGSYAGEHEAALKQTPRKQGRRYRHVTTERLVVEKWGHMRNLQGRAYAPALIPPGVSIDDIK